MNVYKLSAKTQAYYLIEKNDYEQRTARRPPWYKTNASGNPQYFAVCPACNNPIQILGLYKALANTPNPYGKHCGSPVYGVGIYDKEAYLWCPYSNNKRDDGDGRPRRAPGILTQQILSILVNHFDKVVWLLGKSTGVKIDEELAKRMLQQYRREEGWLYARATLMNIPWAFAYMSDFQAILFKRIDKTLAEELVSRSAGRLNYSENGLVIKDAVVKGYVELGIYNTLHHSRVVNDELVETMDMVFTLRQEKEAPTEIYRQTVGFDFNYFNNLVNFSNWKSSAFNDALLALAKETLGDLVN
ncbi:hypothetical protein [Pectobacterium carotovorum]|uniref:Uncharacterized protein n=1 Tax=Pectobacterium carotovorum TaxID=554 RepID=A0A419AX19_PECCA|nr:hypothetical protein [Pectobacterium carotovorum]RJL51852.1 hypothetical protein D5071_09440 [Pectobacterium carotovorum]UFT94994.1 hypothetical protein LQF52_02880 [Pectobacterium carotovorum]